MEEPGAPSNAIYEQRMANLQRLAELGYPPFGRRFDRTGNLGEIRAGFADGREVRAAARVVSSRVMGKSLFATLRDASGEIQVYLKQNGVGEAPFAAFKILDLGDQVGVVGTLFVTRSGEMTIEVREWQLLAKALRPLPEKWHGLSDVDIRYRQRYLDLIANEDARRVFTLRGRIIREIRTFLWQAGYQEVETPMIQGMAGGASANPFQTRYESLHADMFLRIAPELYLKRLLVGGFDKVFELNRNFRNEGLSRNHNPEFTMLEVYAAFGNVDTMRDLAQSLISTVAGNVLGTLRVGTADQPIDLTPPWRIVPYRELIAERVGAGWFELDRDGKAARARDRGLAVEPDWPEIAITQEVFEKLIERTLIQPTFVSRLPVELVPLARACEDDPASVDVFELIIGGREIAPGYTELNDPLEQRRRFEDQAGGDAARIDEDFLAALEHGMPPAGGMGIGIDRLLMILLGAESIRDVILFPQLKPKS